MNILQNIKENQDLRALPPESLPALCGEIREFLVKTVSRTGGHLASNLGAVELTVALHRVYDPEKDRILFDVGHQAYVHKLLTGRREEFARLRCLDGLAGFPKPCESRADPFLAGHASDAVSAAVGMARARTLRGEDYQIVAVLGDGALTGGLSYEGLSDAGASGEPLVVVLNDNGMSIKRSVGGVARWLSAARTRPGYLRFKQEYRRIVGRAPAVYNTLHQVKEWVKGQILPTGFFEDLGFYCIGPVDGHNVGELENALRWARDLRLPVLVHVVTVKGKGVPYAQAEPERYHGVGPFDPVTGELPAEEKDFSACFGETVTRLGARDERVCAVTAAMETGTGLEQFAEKFPDRYFELGIAEGHAAAMCGGMAKQGLCPVFAVYSTFLQRSYDMLIEDIALMGLHVVLAVDRAGLVGRDGVTHQGSFDLAFLSTVPGARIYAPASFQELETMLERAVLEDKGLVAVRYPRGGEGAYREDHGREDATVLRPGTDVTLVTHGVLVNQALEAARLLEERGVSAEVVKLNLLCPPALDVPLASLGRTGRLLCAEEVCRPGSMGMTILAAAAARGVALKASRLLDLGNGAVPHGSVEELRARLGLDAEGMVRAAEKLMGTAGEGHEKAEA